MTNGPTSTDSFYIVMTKRWTLLACGDSGHRGGAEFDEAASVALVFRYQGGLRLCSFPDSGTFYISSQEDAHELRNTCTLDAPLRVYHGRLG